MDHQHHQQTKNGIEYLKFAFVIVFILSFSFYISNSGGPSYMEALMGTFFAVFGGFKLLNLKEFAYGFQSYDLVAANSLSYAYAYPFFQLGFAFLYFNGAGLFWWVNVAVIIVSTISAVGVFRTLGSGAKIHCVCLGNVIKLPLSNISLVEDIGMGLMALAMLIFR